jgi:hypothetical protein
MTIRTFSGADQIDVFDKVDFASSGLSMGEYEKYKKGKEEVFARFPEEHLQKEFYQKKSLKDYLFFGILLLIVFGFLYLKNRGIL